jgi:hypothetical protein
MRTLAKRADYPRPEVFEYFEGFYIPIGRLIHLDQLSQLEFERRHIAL